jgi:hypothetical protein
MSSQPTILTFKRFLMEKNEDFVELIDPMGWADSQDDMSFMLQVEGWSSSRPDTTTHFFMSIPYHQDFYEVMKDYCHFYEMFMLNKFSK